MVVGVVDIAFAQVHAILYGCRGDKKSEKVGTDLLTRAILFEHCDNDHWCKSAIEEMWEAKRAEREMRLRIIISSNAIVGKRRPTASRQIAILKVQ